MKRVVWEALGSDTYIASFGRNEDIPSVGRKHYQKAHIRLSGNAKEFTDHQFDVLAKNNPTLLDVELPEGLILKMPLIMPRNEGAWQGNNFDGYVYQYKSG